MKRLILLPILLLHLFLFAQIYFPPRGAWEHRPPSTLHLDSTKLSRAIQFIYKGYIVAEWGETLRVDMTHSVTKQILTAWTL